MIINPGNIQLINANLTKRKLKEYKIGNYDKRLFLNFTKNKENNLNIIYLNTKYIKYKIDGIEYYNNDIAYYNIDINSVIKNPYMQVDWKILSCHIPFKIIIDNPNLPWFLPSVSFNKTITYEDIISNPKYNWDKLVIPTNSNLFIDDFYGSRNYNLRDACFYMKVKDYEKFFIFVRNNNLFTEIFYNKNIHISYLLNFLWKNMDVYNKNKKFLYILLEREDITFEIFDLINQHWTIDVNKINVTYLAYNLNIKQETIKRTKKIWGGGYIQCVMQPGWYFLNCRDIHDIKTDEFDIEYYKENSPPVNFRGDWCNYDYNKK